MSLSTSTSGDDRGGPTQASTICDRIRVDIMNGTLPPGAKLKTRALADRFRVGLSPIREALSRLSSEGWVSQNDRRGFSVVPVGVAELHDLHAARCMLNDSALRASIRNGDAAWEEHVQLSYFRLSRMERPADMTQGPEAERWNALHRAFHESLVSACGSERITRYCNQLFDEIERYRRLGATARLARGDVEDEHRKIAEAAIGRDADLAVALLNAHFDETVRRVERIIATMDGAGSDG